MAARINEVLAGSIAAELEIEAGDKVLSINNKIINDILDYQFYAQDDYIVLEIQKSGKEIWSIEIEKDYDEELGIVLDGFIFDRMKVCRNNCIFCFIEQLPKKMRKSLYIKDDDYRHSFLFGNFITLTNLDENDWQKILEMKLSPLYVSVHCTRPELRSVIFNNPAAADIKHHLLRLKNAGIEVHTQIVLCPGINDGQILKESIEDLAGYFPSVLSVGIVPVGLTGHRSNLKKLEGVSPKVAEETIAMIDKYQKDFRQRFNRAFVYLADEFYIKAGVEFPESDYYDDYCQIENGIGLARVFLDEFAQLEPHLPLRADVEEAHLITGVSAVPVLQPLVERLNEISGLSLHLLVVDNKFFGGQVTVTGLLTGSDIINALGKEYAGKKVIIPEIVFKDGEDMLLDNIDIREIKERTAARIYTVDGSAKSLVNTIIGQGKGSLVPGQNYGG